MQRMAVVLAFVAGLATTLLPGTSKADPSTGAGVIAFGCQVKLTFPSATSQPFTNCDGYAVGAFVAAASKPGIVAFHNSALPPNKLPLGIDDKCQPSCYQNLRVDKIVYSEPCVSNGEPPVIGSALGFAGIQGDYFDPLPSRPAYVRASFDYVRVAAVFIATLSDLGAHNGTDAKDTAPTGSGHGIAAGVFVPKLLTETLGVCGAPQVNNIDIYGVAVMTADG